MKIQIKIELDEQSELESVLGLLAVISAPKLEKQESNGDIPEDIIRVNDILNNSAKTPAGPPIITGNNFYDEDKDIPDLLRDSIKRFDKYNLGDDKK